MKKLMTVVSVAATLLAFGAVNGDVLTSTGFETEGSNPAYVAGRDLDTAKDDAGEVAGDDFAPTWAPTNLEEGVAIVTAYDGEGAAVKADVAAATGVSATDLGSNYLKLDGAPLITRYAQTATYDPNNDKVVPNPVDIGDGLYIDTLVQFTVSEDTPDQTTEDGDKLCIWVNVDSETGATNLMVKAGYISDESGENITPTAYTTDYPFGGDDNGWHRLTVKAISGIDQYEVLNGFLIYVDGVPVKTSMSVMCDEFAAFSPLAVEGAFPSLISSLSSGGGTLESIGFKGSGSIDNVQFTTTNPIQPPSGGTYELTITATDDATNTVWTATTNGISVASGDFIEDGQAVVVVVTPNTGWEYASTPSDWSEGTAGAITRTFTVSGAALGITIPAPTVKSSGYDSGDGEHTFEIATAKKADLEAALSTLSKTLTDTVPGSSTLTYAQAYALGLWDENDTDVAPLDATISVGADGKVTVTLANQPAEGYVVTCYIYEKASLTAEWPSTPATNYAYGSETAFTPGSATAGFYKVAIVITNQQ